MYVVATHIPCQYFHFIALARYCRSFRKDGANYGKCSSKKETYFGFKVHALITLEGYITAFEITPASVNDREGLRDLTENRLGLVVLGDKGYTGETLLNNPERNPSPVRRMEITNPFCWKSRFR